MLMGENSGLAKGGPYSGMVRFVRRSDTGSPLCVPLPYYHDYDLFEVLFHMVVWRGVSHTYKLCVSGLSMCRYVRGSLREHYVACGLCLVPIL